MGKRGRGMRLVLSFAALALLAMLWGAGMGLSEAQDATMHDCPQASKWAISVWDGPDGTDATEALATCGEGAVDFAYHFDASTWSWLRWFQDHPEISTLLTLDNLQGIVAHGSPRASALSNPRALASTAEQSTMHNCPQEGEWAISVWEGPDGADATEALDTCGEGAVGAAYYLDPDTQGWLRWFRDRPDISTLHTLDNMQGVIALGVILPAEVCAPVFPGTYYGTVTVGGQPAPDGTTVTALLQGIVWASTTTSGGRYVFEVPMAMPVSPPCFAGGTLTFEADGASCQESPQWAAVPQELDLHCLSGPVGDVDCNGGIDAVDAMFILQYVVRMREGSDQCPPPEGHLYLPAGDVDCDDDVDAVDALFVLQHVVGLRDELGCPDLQVAKEGSNRPGTIYPEVRP